MLAGQYCGTQDVVATTYALNLYRQALTVADAGLLSGRYKRTVLFEVAIQEAQVQQLVNYFSDSIF